MGTRLKCSGRISSPKLLSLWKRVDIGHVSKRTKQAQLYHWKLISSAPSRPSLPKVLLLTFALDSLFPGGHRPWTQSLAKQESAVSEQAALPAQSRFRGSLCTRVRTHTRTHAHTHMHAHTHARTHTSSSFRREGVWASSFILLFLLWNVAQFLNSVPKLPTIFSDASEYFPFWFLERFFVDIS